MQNGMTRTFTYDDAGEVLSESYSGGTLGGVSVTNGYDANLRRTNVSVLSPTASVLYSAGYGYDAGSRLEKVVSGSASATYSYLENAALVGQICFTNGGAQRMVTTKRYDFLNRLSSILSVPSSPPQAPAPAAISFAYEYYSANQRTTRTEADLSYWVYRKRPCT